MKNNIKEVFFEKEQAKHTKAKLDILQEYVIPWMRKVVLNKYGSKSCGVIDTFAGAGIYSDGSLGSPIILVKTAIEFIKQAEEKNFKINRILLTFIEKDEKHYSQLKKSIESVIEEELKDGELSNCKKYPQLFIAVENGTHETFLKDLTASVENMIPTVFFMDPFGFDLPFELNKLILSKYSNVELLINFMYEEINRFIAVDSVKKKMGELFGVKDMSSITTKLGNASSEERKQIIKGTYTDNLKKCGAKYTLDFDIRGERGQLKMSMIFVTKNLNGFDTMKEALDKISNTDRLEYIPATDIEESQIRLEGFEKKLDKSDELSEYIYELEKGKTIQIDTLINIVKEHPVIPSKYTKAALKKLNLEGKVERVFRRSGVPVRKNTFPDDAYIKFM